LDVDDIALFVYGEFGFDRVEIDGAFGFTVLTDQMRQLQELFSGREQDASGKISKVIAIYNDLNIRKRTEELANEYISAAFSFLQKVNVDELRKKELTSLASSLIGRNR